MSLYNMLFGVNPHAPMLLGFLGIGADEVPRFRDAFYREGKIVIHTRTGGGNREAYEAENEALTRLPGYVRDEDDNFDCTYANFYYDPHPTVAAILNQFAAKDDEEPETKWKRLLADMDAHKDTPEVKRALEATKPLIDRIAKDMETHNYESDLRRR